LPYTINLTPAAVEDIQTAMDYYNSRSLKLGYRFTDEVDNSLQAIAELPQAYGYRYKNVRAKLLYKFPFLVFFIINDDKSIVEVLSIFHTSQEPYSL
jgi:toxin ParE1/3/4